MLVSHKELPSRLHSCPMWSTLHYRCVKWSAELMSIKTYVQSHIRTGALRGKGWFVEWLNDQLHSRWTKVRSLQTFRLLLCLLVFTSISISGEWDFSGSYILPSTLLGHPRCLIVIFWIWLTHCLVLSSPPPPRLPSLIWKAIFFFCLLGLLFPSDLLYTHMFPA